MFVKLILGIGFGLISIFVLIGMGSMTFEKNPTIQCSDTELEKNFERNEDDFNLLISMSKTDSKVMRIANDFTWLEDNTNWPRPESEIGFSKERWDSYRILFKKLNFSKGLINYSGSNLTYLFCSIEGDVAKGYAFSPKELSPLHDSLDKFPDGYNERKPLYKKLKGNWYIFLKAY